MKGPVDMMLLIRGLDKLYDQCLEDVRREYGLSQIEIVIISFLHNNPSRDTAGDIAAFRMRPKGNVSQGVESLIQKELLTRQPDRSDRRKVHLKLTDKTAEIVRRIDEGRKRYSQMIHKGFSSEEIRQMADFNDRLLKNILDSLERGHLYE